MNISPLLAALGGGAGSFLSQQPGGGGMGAMSPIMAMLQQFHQRQQQRQQGGIMHGGPIPGQAAPNPAVPPAPTMNSGAIPAPTSGGISPDNRRALGLSLMNYGQQMGGARPFGQAY